MLTFCSKSEYSLSWSCTYFISFFISKEVFRCEFEFSQTVKIHQFNLNSFPWQTRHLFVWAFFEKDIQLLQCTYCTISTALRCMNIPVCDYFLYSLWIPIGICSNVFKLCVSKSYLFFLQCFLGWIPVHCSQMFSTLVQVQVVKYRLICVLNYYFVTSHIRGSTWLSYYDCCTNGSKLCCFEPDTYVILWCCCLCIHLPFSLYIYIVQRLTPHQTSMLRF